MIFTNNNQNSKQEASEQQARLNEAVGQRWTALTAPDLAQIQQRVSRLAEIVQQRYQLSIEEARQQVADFEANLQDDMRAIYNSLASKVDEARRQTRAFGRTLRHDISEFGWSVTAERLAARYPAYAVATAALLGLAAGIALGASTRRPRRW